MKSKAYTMRLRLEVTTDSPFKYLRNSKNYTIEVAGPKGVTYYLDVTNAEILEVDDLR